MSLIKVVYFEGCPNAEEVISLLKQLDVSFEKIEQNTLPKHHEFRDYSSPTILRGDEIAFGTKTDSQGGGCSLEIPSLDDLKIYFDISQGTSNRPHFFSTVGAFGSAFTVGFCPICIPAIGAFLSSIGLGFLVQDAVLKPVLILFLLLAWGGFLWSYLKKHRQILPLLMGVFTGITIYIGRYVYIEATLNTALMYGGIIGIVLVGIWNLRLSKRVSCSVCINS